MVTLVQEVKKEAETLNPSPNPFQDILRLLKDGWKGFNVGSRRHHSFLLNKPSVICYNSSRFNDIILCDGPKTFLTSHYSGSLQSFDGDWQSLNFLLICFLVMNYLKWEMLENYDWHIRK